MRDEERGMNSRALGARELGAANRDVPLPDRERPKDRPPDVPGDALSGALLGELTCGAGALRGAVARELVRGLNIRGELSEELLRELPWGSAVERLAEPSFRIGWRSS